MMAERAGKLLYQVGRYDFANCVTVRNLIRIEETLPACEQWHPLMFELIEDNLAGRLLLVVAHANVCERTQRFFGNQVGRHVPVGYLLGEVQKSSLLIHRIAVAPTFQRRRIGTDLYRDACRGSIRRVQADVSEYAAVGVHRFFASLPLPSRAIPRRVGSDLEYIYRFSGGPA